jgi:quinol monooxygenase YgiN
MSPSTETLEREVAMSQITVLARASCHPGREDEMEHALRTNAEASRHEPGCIAYAVLRGENSAFATVEHWRSQADFDQHMTTPHVQTLFAALGPLLATAPEITPFREV